LQAFSLAADEQLAGVPWHDGPFAPPPPSLASADEPEELDASGLAPLLLL
jgi:hypothetical protein